MDNNIGYKHFDHIVFKERYDHQFSGREEKMIDVAQRRADKLYYLFKNGIDWATLKIVNGETDRGELKHYFKLAMQGIYGHIMTYENLNSAVKLKIDKKEIELVNSDEMGAHRAIDLLSAYTYASVCRNSEVINLIFNIPEASPFLDNSNLQHSNPAYALYMMYCHSDQISKNMFRDFEEKSDRNFQNFDDQDFEQLIGIPVNELRKEFFFGTQESFNKQLKVTLDKNKEYYDTEEENRCRDVSNWLPWSIISLASLAYDKGWEITVEDPRLPMFLVKGECKVESLEMK